MMSLFSVFDPISFFGMYLNWVVLMVVFMFIPFVYYIQVSSIMKTSGGVFIQIKKMFNEISFPNYLVLSYLCVMTFLYVVISNLLGLFPFIFCGTAHPMFTMGIGFVMWISFFLMGWFKNMKMSAAHLVPEGSPLVLAPFMVMIESVSHLIRPFTLSIRLAANMMAGHLILGLLASTSLLSSYSIFFSLFLQSILLILEFGVSVIQGFVFSILLLLYALEYY